MKETKKGIRARTCDVAFTFRMGAGFPGDVNRTHPAEIEPALNDTTNPVLAYGVPVIATTSNTVRNIEVGDQSNGTALTPYGFSVRPYPLQASTGTAFGGAALGAATPPAGAIDIMRSGLIIGVLNAGVTAPTKGAPVYVWCAATSGSHIQFGLETAYSAGNTVQLDPNRYIYNGPADASGVVEIAANV